MNRLSPLMMIALATVTGRAHVGPRERASATARAPAIRLQLDILDGKLTTNDEIQKRAAPFWGYQGAWHTAGYEMAALVDKRFGRKSFDECLLDPRLLLARYNEVAEEANAKGASLETWSPELVRKLQPH
jgi:hypothetical protein